MTEARGSGTPAPRPRARLDVVFRPLAREWVLYDPANGQLHVLNVTAALAWGLCDGTSDLDAMVSHVRDALDDAPSRERVREDLEAILQRFTIEGLLS